ncbi:response regulator [Croceicoccus sp. YJ47]|uniref:response regulator n=1 Tax=Croceicoccus sp. YJ47 TaxID=2798724 RepID=UPI001923401F|nr:response regulator [Croceicoccus sp. YJ47]QQN74224.1 response regulator [Croceicoccus sp. YJ47]
MDDAVVAALAGVAIGLAIVCAWLLARRWRAASSPTEGAGEADGPAPVETGDDSRELPAPPIMREEAPKHIGDVLVHTETEPKVAASASGDWPASGRRDVSGARILLAEDSDISRDVMLRMLRELGVAAEAVGDGQEAVDAVERAHREGRAFGGILMDMEMPVMDGVTAARTIRANGFAASDLPILAITANGGAEDTQRCLAAGMQDHLTKPLSSERLRDALCKWVDAPLATPDKAARGDDAIASLEALYARRKRELLIEMEDYLALEIPDADRTEKLRDEMHIMAGIAAHFGDQQIGDRARRLQDELGDGEGRADLIRLSRCLEQG